MKKIFSLIFICAFCLVGCTDKLTEIKDAASGIQTKANEAATVLTEDVHTLRDLKVDVNDKQVSINTLMKNTLRDVQWTYEKETIAFLHVKGTWKDDLFESYSFTEDEKKVLRENGKVYVTFAFAEQQLQPAQSTLKLIVNDKQIIQENGEIVLQYFKEAYLK